MTLPIGNISTQKSDRYTHAIDELLLRMIMKRLMLKQLSLLLFALFIVVPIVQGQDVTETTDGLYYRTLGEANFRECAELDCPLIRTYWGDALLIVDDIVDGEELNGTQEWIQIYDHLTAKTGYIHSSLTEEFTPEPWMVAPIVPQVTDTAREIYQRGLELGNHHNHFSKVGDCQNVSSHFLSIFDDPDAYALGEFDSLQSTIEHFGESWARDSASVDNGFNVASVLSPLWSDPEICNPDENPLECEYRLNKPSIVIVSMETWWAQRPAEEYEDYMRQIVEFWIDHGVVPILSTKADNLEGNYGLNRAVYKVAQEYDIPMWNFWLSIQSLPGNGLSEDDFHLTFARNFFDDPVRMQYSWPVRNLTALQAIDAVYQGLQEPTESS